MKNAICLAVLCLGLGLLAVGVQQLRPRRTRVARYL